MVRGRRESVKDERDVGVKVELRGMLDEGASDAWRRVTSYASCAHFFTSSLLSLQRARHASHAPHARARTRPPYFGQQQHDELHRALEPQQRLGVGAAALGVLAGGDVSVNHRGKCDVWCGRGRACWGEMNACVRGALSA